ncbi:CoA pyrophosphatase [Orrella sp. JC864]|uniref:CoA pyrophosphatase n=1 Tax=Orrella sp. JC864 TaxID=3120298 RepID=UPI0012BD3D38
MAEHPPSGKAAPRARLAPAFDPTEQPWRVANEGLAPVDPGLLTPHALRGILSAPPSWTPDPSLEERWRTPGREGPPVQAAVLIPMVVHEAGLKVMLTQRAAHLRDHAGQISFPGGRIESWDASPVAAALRETQEETGLTGDYVEILGSLPPYVTTTGYSVTPVAALVRPGFTLKPDAFEVADIFEVPLAFLTDPANHRLHVATLADGRQRQFYSMPWNGRFIWGATAAMLRNFYHLLRHAQLSSWQSR